jgi:hypothetical protein
MLTPILHILPVLMLCTRLLEHSISTLFFFTIIAINPGIFSVFDYCSYSAPAPESTIFKVRYHFIIYDILGLHSQLTIPEFRITHPTVHSV